MSAGGNWEPLHGTRLTDGVGRAAGPSSGCATTMRSLPGAALDRLLGLAGRFEVPVALAVIAAHAGDGARPARRRLSGWQRSSFMAGRTKTTPFRARRSRNSACIGRPGRSSTNWRWHLGE